MHHLAQSRSHLLHALRRRLASASTRLRDETGSALVELATVLCLLGIPLLLGTVYSAMLLENYIDITNAAHAGALYAMRSATFAEDNSGIVSAAQTDASDLGANLAVTPSIYYVCSDEQDGTQYTTESAAQTACTGASSHALEFVQVIASAPITPPTTFPGMPKTMTLSSTSVMEVEE